MNLNPSDERARLKPAHETGERFILVIRCRDQLGIVAAVAGLLAELRCNIVESAQFGDRASGAFFLRILFEALQPDAMTHARIAKALGPVVARFEMNWSLHPESKRTRAMLMVSKLGHCLNDLLYRYSIAEIPIQIVAVVSNHDSLRRLVEPSGLPFHHMPVTPATRATQEAELLELVTHYQVDLVVLARYMQILSLETCAKLAGRAINIHHSFLPSFKGAHPYHQAHERGVKLIGATAHYVTAELDEGPIIEQDVVKVTHAQTPRDLVAIGRDLESIVLARAVRKHCEHRVVLNGRKTVVF